MSATVAVAPSSASTSLAALAISYEVTSSGRLSVLTASRIDSSPVSSVASSAFFAYAFCSVAAASSSKVALASSSSFSSSNF